MEDGLTRLSGADLVSVSTDGAPEGEVVGINADTLGGYAADAYVKKTDDDINANTFDGRPSSDYVLKTDGMVVTKNYSVVGRMEEPINPTENMIWVQTENNTIGKVYFSGVEPSSVNNNDIWIYTGNSSSVAFDAIKIGDDTMNTVYPLSVKQYVSGAWVSVEAKSFQNGVWVDWVEVFYPNGKLSNWAVGYTQRANGSLTISDGDLVLTSTSAESGELRTVFYSDDKIDVTDISEFIVNMTIVANRGSWRVALVNNVTANPHDHVVCEVMNEGTGAWEAKLDVSNVSGAYYFAIYYTSWSATAGQTHTANVHAIKDH